MRRPCLPSICHTSQAETAISSMIFCTGDPYWQFAAHKVARSVSYSWADQMGEGQTLATLALGCRRLKRLHFANVLPLPCRVSRPGQAEVTLPSFPQLSQLDFAWLMNCDRTQLQGCLCDFFFSLPGKPVRAGVWSIVELRWWLSTFILAGLAAFVTHSSEHLKDPHCQDVRVAGRTASCLCFNTKRRA